MRLPSNFLASHGQGPLKPGRDPNLLEGRCRFALLAAHDPSDVLARANGEPTWSIRACRQRDVEN
jgi:hypothetical protein